MIITGTADPLVSEKGIQGDPAKDMLPLVSTEANIDYWKRRNDIVWLKVVNGGHWLPTYANGKALDASDLDGFDGSYMGTLNCDYMASTGIYDFLLSHSRK